MEWGSAMAVMTGPVTGYRYRFDQSYAQRVAVSDTAAWVKQYNPSPLPLPAAVDNKIVIENVPFRVRVYTESEIAALVAAVS